MMGARIYDYAALSAPLAPSSSLGLFVWYHRLKVLDRERQVGFAVLAPFKSCT